MGGEKHGSKSGRYVGGFLQLFDWNAKSRKKLFPSRSDLPEQSKQGKKCEGNLPTSRMRVVEDEEIGAGLSIRRGSEYSYASSVTDDDAHGTKAPGVVARLMGLDSMPTTSATEPFPSPFYDTRSLPDAPGRGRNLDFYQEHQVMHSSHHFDEVESSSKTATVSRPTRTMSNRPIEKFQTEMLPPKSAKTIPLTHHKLLSPIKSPIFVPSHDAAHIMEAAAKIIEPGPQATSRGKISSVRSSSVPFKEREMREKVEAGQRPGKVSGPMHRQVESNASKYLRRQTMNKSCNGGTVEASSHKVTPSRDDSISTSIAKGNGKSISLAIQAKVNVQKREGLTSSSRSLASEEQDDVNSTQILRNQVSSSKSTDRKPLTKSDSVLRQNNQKQNCPSYRDKPGSKISVASSAGKKVDKSLTRVSSRKSGLHGRDGDKETPYSGPRNVPRKKRSIDGSLNYNKNQVTNNMLVSNHETLSQSRMVADKQYTWIEENRRKGLDVVSFTFTAPITRSLPVSETLRRVNEKRSDFCTDDRSKLFTNSDSTKLSSPGFNGLKGDALSILLEQKLKELASNLGSPHRFEKTGLESEIGQDTMLSPGSVESAIGKARDKAFQQEFRVNGMNSQMCSGLTGLPRSIRRIFDFQTGEAMEDYSNNTETKQWNCQLPSPVSILEPSMLSDSCYSSESLASSNTEESKHCSSVLAQEAVEISMDTSDSASSTSSRIPSAKHSVKTVSWDFQYVNNILCNVELMFKDYVTGRTHEIVNPRLFDQLERPTLIGDNNSKLERKLLFDCVGECLDVKCQRIVEGGFNIWVKGVSTLKRKERLAEEVYKEIDGWRSLGNCMVDELVDRDMSSKYGRWLDFEDDDFMLGVEIEGEILDSLVDEIVDDLLYY